MSAGRPLRDALGQRTDVSALAAARAPFGWFGGKHELAPELVGLLPQHLVYVEVFGGAASVLLAKAHSRLEVYNDRDGGLVDFFRVLRDHPEELERRLRLTPFSRAEFDLCRRTWADQTDEIERARRWYVRVEQAFAGTPLTTGWAGERLGRRHGSRARTSLRRLDRLHAIAHRLRSVQIENLDWRDALERYDHRDAVFYLDPPYVRETRRRPRTRGGLDYAHELTTADHAELVQRVLALEGSTLLSGYDHPVYAALEQAGFERFEFEVLARSPRRQPGHDVDTARTEIVWRRLNHTGQLW